MQSREASCTWIVQSTVRNDTLERIRNACLANGNPFHRIDIVPHSQEMPKHMPDVEGPFLLYGYTTLLRNAFQSMHWRRGVFFDPNVFRYHVYLEYWGRQRMLNHDAQFLTMEEFADYSATTPSTSWFVKPDDDLKQFTGVVMTHREYCEWYADMGKGLNGKKVGPETEIVVCEPKAVSYEWRLFLVDGKTVAKTCYRNTGHDLPLPPELEQFAQDAVREWSPAPAFVLDVTMDATGTPRIVEANCINGSGLYSVDAHDFVRALSRWQEIVWE